MKYKLVFGIFLIILGLILFLATIFALMTSSRMAGPNTNDRIFVVLFIEISIIIIGIIMVVKSLKDKKISE